MHVVSVNTDHEESLLYSPKYLGASRKSEKKKKRIIAFDVGRTLPNTDLSRDFMGLVVDGSMDLGTHIWHPPQIFLQGRMTSQRERAWDRVTSNALSNLRLLLVIIKNQHSPSPIEGCTGKD